MSTDQGRFQALCATMQPDGAAVAAIATAPTTNFLRVLWEDRIARGLDRYAWFYRCISRSALAQGECLMAADCAEEGLLRYPAEPVLVHTLALALVHTGSYDRAEAVLAALPVEKRSGMELLTLEGRLHKDAWLLDTDSCESRRHLRLAADLYVRAFERSKRRDPFPGVNAATLHLLLGKRNEAEAIAARVAKICRGLLARRGRSEWGIASLAEALLVLRRAEESLPLYAEAAQLMGSRLRDVCSMRRQSRLIAGHLGLDFTPFESAFGLPPVLLFAGHMTDAPTRAHPRFPASEAPRVTGALAALCAKYPGAIAFLGAAAGSDLICAEQVLAHCGSVNVVLPWERGEFLGTSVLAAGGIGWKERYASVLARAASVRELGRTPSSVADIGYSFTMRVMIGLGILQARALDLEIRAAAVWDGLPGLPGGTGEFVDVCGKSGLQIDVIPPLERFAAANQAGPGPQLRRPSRRKDSQQIRAILFADVIGYSRMQEQAIPRFVRVYLGGIARLVRSSPAPPLVRNTWGDGLYMVFPSVEAAGRFAISLRRMVLSTDWQRHQLPAGINVRIGLHAGPVFRIRDPVLGCSTFAGTHVTYSARLEPVTQPGCIFASEAFAALSTLEAPGMFRFNYMGIVQMSKDFGPARVYLVNDGETTGAAARNEGSFGGAAAPIRRAGSPAATAPPRRPASPPDRAGRRSCR